MKMLSFGARGLKNREETAKENENGNIASGGRGPGEPPPLFPVHPRWMFVRQARARLLVTQLGVLC